MMRLLVCLVLLASPMFTSICNLDNCFNIRSGELNSGVLLDDIVDSSNLTRTTVVALTGEVQDNCLLSMACTSDAVNWKTILKLSLTNARWNLLLEHNPNTGRGENYVTLVNTTAQNQPASVNQRNSFTLDTRLQFNLGDRVFAYYFSEDLDKSECSYEKLETSKKTIIGQSSRLLKGENGTWEKIYRELSTINCGDDLTISLCPCSEPVITELSWNEETETLHCTAASIEGRENLTITWTENNTSVQNVTENFTNTELTKTSILYNVTSLETSRDITCTVSMLSNNASSTTRTITIPARSEDSEHPDGEASKDTDGENTNSQAFLTILITIIVVSVVAVALICVGVIKLVQHYKDNKTPEPPTLDAVEPTAGNSEVDEGAIIHLYEEERGSGTQIESNYQDLEELLDAVEPRVIPTDEVPLYTAVNIKKPIEQENIYNRLDPKRMTANRGDPDRWRTFRPGETGASPHTMGASSNARMGHQPPVTSAPPVPGTLTQGSNFSPAPEEGLYEMQTLKL